MLFLSQDVRLQVVGGGIFGQALHGWSKIKVEAFKHGCLGFMTKKSFLGFNDDITFEVLTQLVT